MSSSSSSFSKLSLLENTLEDLQIRSNVEETMQDMLQNVELAWSLNNRVQQHLEVLGLKQSLQESRVAMQETNAMQKQHGQQHIQLANEFCQEMWNLSIMLGTKIQQEQNLESKLREAQEELRVLKQQKQETPQNVKPPATTTADESPGAAEDSTEVASTAAASADALGAATTDTTKASPEPPPVAVEEKEESPTTDTSHDSPSPHVVDEEPVVAIESFPEQQQQHETRVQEEDTTNSSNVVSITEQPVLSPSRQEENDAALVVALLEEEEQQQAPPNLSELDMEILNRIFEYLDAFDILRTAQCNISLYSRVDSLFGLGGGDVEATSAATTQESTRQAQSNTQQQQQPAAASRRVDPPGASATRVSSFPAASFMNPTATSSTTTLSSPPRFLGGAGRQAGGLFSMLQNRTQARSAVPEPTTTAPVDDQQPALNRSAVNSMADKLTPTELSAIISMTEKLYGKEKQVKLLAQEKEELAGRLQGTERFKEFLSQKVLDLEKSLRQHQEDQTKVTLQIASDQEVIAFLDSRVQELERNQVVLTNEKKHLVAEMEHAQEQNTKKVRVLSDMLQFERERLVENEKDWKATKKLLVKEVKNCRAQIMAAQAERDGYREQNERLKKAVLINGAGRGSERMDIMS